MQVDLDEAVRRASLRGVTAERATLQGKRALRVELTPGASAGVAGVDFVDQPTFVELPVSFRTGKLAVDILSSFNGWYPEVARGFAGLAYRIAPDAASFECVYVRPANGLKHSPRAPRAARAVQYFAYPDWKFDRLRQECPGEYEVGADIGLDEWLRLEVDVAEDDLTVRVNGVAVLSARPRGLPIPGNIGLFVDIGTIAIFSNLSVH